MPLKWFPMLVVSIKCEYITQVAVIEARMPLLQPTPSFSLSAAVPLLDGFDKGRNLGYIVKMYSKKYRIMI